MGSQACPAPNGEASLYSIPSEARPAAADKERRLPYLMAPVSQTQLEACTTRWHASAFSANQTTLVLSCIVLQCAFLPSREPCPTP